MSTAAWAPLLPAAMVGTERHSAPWPNLPGEIGALASQATASTDEPATALLRVAAVLATCALAGARGAALSVALPHAAADDTFWSKSGRFGPRLPSISPPKWRDFVVCCETC